MLLDIQIEDSFKSLILLSKSGRDKHIALLILTVSKAQLLISIKLIPSLIPSYSNYYVKPLMGYI